MQTPTMTRPVSLEELEYLRKKREEVASQLRALGITREQLEREALEIVRAIREGRDPEGGC